jgi:hypothetical protein
MIAAVYWARVPNGHLIGLVRETEVKVSAESILRDEYGIGPIAGQLWERASEGAEALA